MGWGFLGKLGKFALNFVPGGGAVSDAIDIIGDVAGGASKSMAANRSAQANGQMSKLMLQERALADKSQEQRANADSAFKRLLHTNYLASGGIKSPGRAGQYSRPAPEIAPQNVEMANNPALREALMSRATYQHDPMAGLDFSSFDKTQKSGFMEKLLGGAGLGLNGLSALSGLKKPKTDDINV